MFRKILRIRANKFGAVGNNLTKLSTWCVAGQGWKFK